MTRLRYIADRPRGKRGGHNDNRHLYTDLKSATRATLAVKELGPGRVLCVDLDELLPVDADAETLFAWHESRALHHTAEMMRLRPTATASQLEAVWLSTQDLARLREVVSEWVDKASLGKADKPEARRESPMKRTDAGLAARLLEAGWLPPRAAAAALEMTLQELERHIRQGGLRARTVGGMRLVEIPGRTT